MEYVKIMCFKCHCVSLMYLFKNICCQGTNVSHRCEDFSKVG